MVYVERDEHTSKGEAPEVANVDEPDEQRQTRNLPALEEQAVACQLNLDLLREGQGALLIARTNQLSGALCRVGLGSQSLKVLQAHAAFTLVDLGDVLEYLDSLLVLATVHEEFGRLLEIEDHEAQEEDE